MTPHEWFIPVTAGCPKKAIETVTLKTVFERLAEAQDMTKKQGVAMATGMVDLVTEHLEGRRPSTPERPWHS